MARDPGLQPERTVLAWRRTTLALAVATLIIGRLTFTQLGLSVIVPTLVALAGAGWAVVVTARRRGVTHSRELEFTTLLPDGRLPLVVAMIAGALCLGELIGLTAQLL